MVTPMEDAGCDAARGSDVKRGVKDPKGGVQGRAEKESPISPIPAAEPAQTIPLGKRPSAPKA